MKNIRCLFLILVLFGAPGAAVAEPSDPIEPVNRGIFWFNDQLDMYVLEPVAKGYDEYLPKPVQTGVHNFFQNIKSPVYVVSDLVQFKFAQAGNHTGRFLINSTIGVVGLIDVAKEFGMRHESEDFGVALGYHGIPPGPYIVLPILGPSNLRDLFGRVVDSFLNPVNYVHTFAGDGVEIEIGATVLDGIDGRANLLDAIASAKEASVDYYSFVKNSFHQHRQNLIYDNNPPEESTDADEIDEVDADVAAETNVVDGRSVDPQTGEPDAGPVDSNATEEK